MEQTSAYQLNLWDEEDRIQREDFNADNAKTEQALAGMAALAAAAGNCDIEVLTYTGTGTYGSSGSRAITFTQTPDIFFVFGDLAMLTGHSGATDTLIVCKDPTYSDCFIENITSASWTGSQLSLYNNAHARYQMNTKNKPYWVLGLRKRS